MDLVKFVEDTFTEKKDFPEFKAGDTVTVVYKIKEGNISNGVGVERIFPLFSPKIARIEVNKRGVVRRARIFYLRGIFGKKARIEEKRV